MNTRIIGALLAALMCITLVVPAMALEPSTPFIITGHVSNSDGNPCNGTWVQVTNTNTSTSWNAENDSASNYYRHVLDSDDVSTGNVLQIEASGCTETKIVEHTLTQSELEDGGMVDFDIVFDTPQEIVWQGNVTLINGTTFDVMANSSVSYVINRTTALGALDAAAEKGIFTYTISDEYYLSWGSLFVDSIADIPSEGYNGWMYWVNYPEDPMPMVGADQFVLEDGDVVTWYWSSSMEMTPADSPMIVNVTVAIEEPQEIIWQGDVTLINGTTFDKTACNSGVSYDVNRTTALGALDAAAEEGVFNYNISDEWYASYGSLLVDSIADIPSEGYNGWMYWVNYPEDPMPMVGADQFVLEDGDVVTWYWSSSMEMTPADSPMIVNVTVAIEEPQEIIWQGDVTLINGTTFDKTACNSGVSYDVNRTTALGALDAAAEEGVFNYNISDEWYASYGSLLVDSIADIPSEGYNGWMYWVNYPEDPMPMVGADQFVLEDGDVVTWYWSSSMEMTPVNSSMLMEINVTVTSPDTPPPVVTITSPANGSTVTIAEITVTGTASDDSGIASVTVNGETVEGIETWSKTITLTEGENTITVVATDNEAIIASETITVTLDSTAPVVTIYSPSAKTNDNTPLLYATFDEIVASKWYVIDGAAGTGGSNTNNLTVTLPELADGQHTVTVKASDSAGNVGNATQDFLVDTTLPSIISVTLNDTVVKTDAPIEVNVSATDENEIVSVMANETLLNLTDGYYVGTIIASTSPVIIIVTDEAGNMVTHTSVYIIDDELPKVNITEPLHNTTTRFVDNTVRGEVIDDNFESATLTVKNETGLVSHYNLSILDNIFRERVEFTPNQNNTLELFAIDEAGNSNSCTIVVFVENNTMQEECDVNVSAPVNIDAMNETDTKIEFYSNVTKSNVTFTVTAITDETRMDKLNGSAFAASSEMAVGKIVAINVTGLDATNESEVHHVLIKLYYTIYDLDLDADGTVEPGELDEDNMFIYWCNKSDNGNWTKLVKDENDPDLDWVIDNGQMKISGDNPGHVWVKVKHLSMFGLVSLPEPEPSDDGDGNNGNGGSSSSGGGASGELYENIAYSETDRQYVYANSDICYSFELEYNIVQFVKFNSLNSAGQVATKVEILNDTSTLVDHAPSDIVYKNLNIWVGNAGWATAGNIADATVVFTVEKSWITENNIDESSIALYHYSDDTWHELVTRKIAEDANSLQFEAETPGFSPFAVTGKKTIGENGGDGIIAEPTVTAEKTPIPTPTEKKGMPGFGVFAGLSVLLITVRLLREDK